MISPLQKEFLFSKGKRKLIFCSDSKNEEIFDHLVKQAIEENTPYQFFMIEKESDYCISQLLSQQKMGTYLYLSGKWEFVNRLMSLALEAGFTEHDMQMKVLGPIQKKLICSKCYGVNDVGDHLHITCNHCHLKLEVTNHYSRRLEAYLGYSPIS